MSSKSFTKKQYNAAKKRRSTTLKKLDILYEKAKVLSDEQEEFRIKWLECKEQISPSKYTTKKELKKKESECNKILKKMHKCEKDRIKISKKTNILDKKVGEIEDKYHIKMNESY